MVKRLSAALMLLMAAVAGRASPGAQTEAGSVWDGVYTEEQATRGGVFYAKECASCHGEGLNGEGDASALVGAGFLATWGGQSVGDLFQQTRKSMPKDKENAFSRQQYADVIAFVLRANNFPAGRIELPREDVPLSRIRIDVYRDAAR